MHTQQYASIDTEAITNFLDLLERSPQTAINSTTIATACPQVYQKVSITGCMLGLIGFDKTLWWKNRYLISLALEIIAKVKPVSLQEQLKARTQKILPRDPQPSFFGAIREHFFCMPQGNGQTTLSDDEHSIAILVQEIAKELYPLHAVETLYQLLSTSTTQYSEECIRKLYTTLTCLEQQMHEKLSAENTFSAKQDPQLCTQYNLRKQIYAYAMAALILLDFSQKQGAERLITFEQFFTTMHPLWQNLSKRNTILP